MPPGDEVWARERKQAEALGWGFTLLESIDPRAAGLIPLHFQQQNGLLAFGSSQRDGLELLHVAVDGPAREDVVDELRFQMQRAVKLFLCPPSVLREGWAVAASGKGRGPTPAPLPATPLPPAHTPVPLSAPLPAVEVAPGHADQEEVLEELELILEPEMIVEEAAPLAEVIPEPLAPEISDGWSDELDALPPPVEDTGAILQPAIAAPPSEPSNPVAAATTPDAPQRPMAGKVPLPGATPGARVAISPGTAKWSSSQQAPPAAPTGASGAAHPTPGAASPVPPPAGGGHTGGWSPVFRPSRGETPVPSQVLAEGDGWSPGTPAGGARSLGAVVPDAALASSAEPSPVSAATFTAQDAPVPGADLATSPVPEAGAPVGPDTSEDMVDTDWAKELLPDGPPPPPPDAEPGAELLLNELTPSAGTNPIAEEGSDLVDTDWAKDFLPDGPPPQPQSGGAEGGLESGLDAAFEWDEPGAPGGAGAHPLLQSTPETARLGDAAPMDAVNVAADPAEIATLAGAAPMDAVTVATDITTGALEAPVPGNAPPAETETETDAVATAAENLVAATEAGASGLSFEADLDALEAESPVRESASDGRPGPDLAETGEGDASIGVAASTFVADVMVNEASAAEIEAAEADPWAAGSTNAAPTGVAGSEATDDVESEAERSATATDAAPFGVVGSEAGDEVGFESERLAAAADALPTGVVGSEAGDDVAAEGAAASLTDVSGIEARDEVAAEAENPTAATDAAPTVVGSSEAGDDVAAEPENPAAATDASPSDLAGSESRDDVASKAEDPAAAMDAAPTHLAGSEARDDDAAEADTWAAETTDARPVVGAGTEDRAQDLAPSPAGSEGRAVPLVTHEEVDGKGRAPGLPEVEVDGDAMGLGDGSLGRDLDEGRAEAASGSAGAPVPDAQAGTTGAESEVGSKLLGLLEDGGLDLPSDSAVAAIPAPETVRPTDEAPLGLMGTAADGDRPTVDALAAPADPRGADTQSEGEGASLELHDASEVRDGEDPKQDLLGRAPHDASEVRDGEDPKQDLLTREADDAPAPDAGAPAQELRPDETAQDQDTATETFDTDWAKELLPDGPPPPPTDVAAGRPDALRALSEGSSDQRFGFSPEELAILDGLERLAMGIDEEAAAEKVRPARMIASVVRLLLRKGLIDERELLDELSRG